MCEYPITRSFLSPSSTSINHHQRGPSSRDKQAIELYACVKFLPFSLNSQYSYCWSSCIDYFTINKQKILANAHTNTVIHQLTCSREGEGKSEWSYYIISIMIERRRRRASKTHRRSHNNERWSCRDDDRIALGRPRSSSSSTSSIHTTTSGCDDRVRVQQTIQDDDEGGKIHAA